MAWARMASGLLASGESTLKGSWMLKVSLSPAWRSEYARAPSLLLRLLEIGDELVGHLLRGVFTRWLSSLSFRMALR